MYGTGTMRASTCFHFLSRSLFPTTAIPARAVLLPPFKPVGNHWARAWSAGGEARGFKIVLFKIWRRSTMPSNGQFES